MSFKNMSKLIEWLKETAILARLYCRLALRRPSDWRQLLARFDEISRNVECAHNPSHVLEYVIDVLSLPTSLSGAMVEAGCFKGGSAAKASIIAKLTGRELIVFDSFEGLPPNAEEHRKSTLGHSIEDRFTGGNYRGTLDEVLANIKAFGEIDVCRFVKGWFEDTMGSFMTPVASLYLDVDLATSTKTCLRQLYPHIVPGGILYSQDGDLPLVIEVLDDDHFWKMALGRSKPDIQGLGKRKMLKIVV